MLGRRTLRAVHDGPLLLPPLLLAAVLALSGVAKVGETRATRDATAALGLGRRMAGSPLPVMLPWVEIGLALGLLALPGGWASLAATLALLLLLGFTVLVARVVRRGDDVACGCFGRIGQGRIGPRTLLRNGLLVLVAALSLLGSTDGRSVLSRLLDADGVTWAWLGVAGLGAAVTALVAGGPREGLLTRTRPDRADDGGTAELDYLRQPIPFGTLLQPSGARIALPELASRQAQLLVPVSATCPPCVRVIEEIPGWQAQMDVVAIRPVFISDLGDAMDRHPQVAKAALADPEQILLRTFQVSTPAAVLLGADGLLAGGPVQGEDEVRRLVADILDELAAADE